MDQTLTFNSDVGYITLIASESGLKRLLIAQKGTESDQPGSDFLESVKSKLQRYFDGEVVDFTTITLDWSGFSEFYKKVWQRVMEIPHGKTASYNDIAIALDNKKAVRAVGMANGKNPIPIIVPCHRVIASSGKLQGYYYGLDMKKYLLSLESKNAAVEQGALF